MSKQLEGGHAQNVTRILFNWRISETDKCYTTGTNHTGGNLERRRITFLRLLVRFIAWCDGYVNQNEERERKTKTMTFDRLVGKSPCLSPRLSYRKSSSNNITVPIVSLEKQATSRHSLNK